MVGVQFAAPSCKVLLYIGRARIVLGLPATIPWHYTKNACSWPVIPSLVRSV